VVVCLEPGADLFSWTYSTAKRKQIKLADGMQLGLDYTLHRRFRSTCNFHIDKQVIAPGVARRYAPRRWQFDSR